MKSKFHPAGGKKERKGYRWLSYIFVPSLLAMTALLVIRPGFARQRPPVDDLTPEAAEAAKDPTYEKFDSQLARVLDARRKAQEGRLTRQEAEAAVSEVA